MTAYKVLDALRKITGAAAGVICALFAIKLLKGCNCKKLKKLM